MKTNKKGIELIKEFEGFSARAYLCPAGIWTIGYGTTRPMGGDPVRPGQVISPATAEKYLAHDLQVFESGVSKVVKVPINKNQFSALVSFAYNLGLGNLSVSTLLKVINADPSSDQIGYEFSRWNKAGGKVLTGLIRRRKAEAELYFS